MSILDRLRKHLGHQDLLFAGAIVLLLSVLVLPMPTWLVDGGLAFSITLSVLILMVALWIDKPLDFSAFPVVLLVATLLRLALNLATTRLILAHGNEGLDAAGSVIRGFASFVLGGDYATGMIVFAVLLIVNFIVVTKGAGRIAEVSARFSLDAMPGKQMAIDADLAAGAIDDAEAKRRRTELEDESSFYGSMDGASKFVRGDAIAGLIITFVNLVGGIAIGTLRHGMSVGSAASSYATLTIGDGVVTQIPALIVSVGAGLLVSKGNVRGSTDKAFIGQLAAQPKPLFLAGGLAMLFAILPGLPFAPFAVLGAAAAGAGVLAQRAAKKSDAVSAPVAPAAAEESITDLMRVDEIRLELGLGLVHLTSGSGDGLGERIKKLRRQFALEYGFALPAVRIKDNLDHASGEYAIQIQGVEVARETLSLGRLLVFSTSGDDIKVPGTDAVEPAFRLRARWIEPAHREEAERAGLRAVDALTVLTTHLSEVLAGSLGQLQGYDATQALLDGLGPSHKRLVADLIPATIPLATLQKVLSNLLSERVSIRNLPAILEATHEASGFTRNAAAVTEHVRQRLGSQICKALAGSDGYLQVLVLSPEWEREVSEAIRIDGDQRSYEMPPTRTQALLSAAKNGFAEATRRGEWPALLCSADARPFIRHLIVRYNPAFSVISHPEIPPRTKLRSVGQI